jgi:hypothetical protein
MEATVVDLRYHMNEVLKALDRNESVSVLYRGKIKGVLRPAGKKTTTAVADHEFFGCRAPGRSVEQIMGQLRGGRHRDV